MSASPCPAIAHRRPAFARLLRAGLMIALMAATAPGKAQPTTGTVKLTAQERELLDTLVGAHRAQLLQACDQRVSLATKSYTDLINGYVSYTGKPRDEVIGALARSLNSSDQLEVAMSLLVSGKYDAAVEAARNAADYWSKFTNSLSTQAYCYRMEGQAREAQSKFDAAVRAYSGGLVKLENATEARDVFNRSLMLGRVGSALTNQGVNSKDKTECLSLLVKAEDRYRRAIATLDRKAYPSEWGHYQNTLGLNLYQQCLQLKNELAMEALRKMDVECSKALEVYDRTNYPADWGIVHGNLGLCHKVMGGLSSGPKALTAYGKAVIECQLALDVCDKKRQPQRWDLLQSRLGDCLSDQALRSKESTGADLLSAAVEAWRQVLSVRSRESNPVSWASAHSQLGWVLKEEGMRRSDPTTALKRLEQAENTHRAQLLVHKRETSPAEWASAQMDVTIAIVERGKRSLAGMRVQLLSEGIKNYRDIMLVRTRTLAPKDWALMQSNLAVTLKELAEEVRGQQGLDLLAQAVTACESALEVRNRETMPEDWALTQHNLGTNRFLQGDLTEATTLRQRFYKGAEAAYLNALQVWTQESDAFHYKMASDNLKLLRARKDWPSP